KGGSPATSKRSRGCRGRTTWGDRNRLPWMTEPTLDYQIVQTGCLLLGVGLRELAGAQTLDQTSKFNAYLVLADQHGASLFRPQADGPQRLLGFGAQEGNAFGSDGRDVDRAARRRVLDAEQHLAVFVFVLPANLTEIHHITPVNFVLRSIRTGTA